MEHKNTNVIHQEHKFCSQSLFMFEKRENEFVSDFKHPDVIARELPWKTD